MKTYYINLSKNKEKREHIEKYFPEAERIDAVDGSLLLPEDILPLKADKDWRDPYWNRRLTKGEVGCTLSHMKAWAYCVEQNKPIIVLEDDVVPAVDNWKEIALNYEHAFDLLYLGRKYIEGKVESINEQLESPGFSYWTCAYIISPKLALELINYCNSNPIIPADEVLPLVAGLHRTLKYNTNQDFYCAAFKNNIVKPKFDAFASSDTETPTNIWSNFKMNILTVATDEDKGQKLLSSPFPIKNIGAGVEWRGGTMEGPGGGQKINLIRKELNNYEDNDVILFLDGYDTFISVSSVDEILNRYLEFKKEVVFAAETFCWPDKSIQDQFPETGGYKFLNSGCFIGTVKELKKIFSESILDHEDDQLYCQKQYLTNNYDIALDYESYLFFCMSGAENSWVYSQTSYIINTDTNCTSCVVHGNGGAEAKKAFNTAYNKVFKPIFYIPKQEYKDVHQLDKDIFVLHNFLSEEYCNDLIRETEECGGWQELPNDKYPAQEIRLQKLNSIFYDTFNAAYNSKLVPFVERKWDCLKMYEIRDLFAIKYSMQSQKSLRLHHDMSLVSGSLKLNNTYTGGELVFPRQGVTNSELEVGSIIIWPGQVTHPHECKELTSGTKYSLTLWTARLEGTADIYNG